VKTKPNWRIYPSKARGVMIEYRDLSGKLLLALNYKPEQARDLANQLLDAAEERRNQPRRISS
jgi:hypothetical protein